jgi:CheY-like chemotaxis protein
LTGRPHCISLCATEGGISATNKRFRAEHGSQTAQGANFLAQINLRGFTALIVDQDDAHRWMIHNLLKALGVGNVLTAANIDEALNLLKRLSKKPVSERIDTVDFMICEMGESDLDGVAMVRWVRMHRDSPNRFLPVILMANSFAPNEIAEARGFGATHFLLKPVTVDTLVDRILTIINRPRPFVYNPDYFGPDRRGNVKDVAEDRRELDPSDVRVDRSPVVTALERFPNDSVIRIFRPPNHLKRKAGGGDDTDALFTEGAVFKAGKEMEKSKREYVGSAMDYVESLKRIMAEAEPVADKSEHFQRIHTLARQLGLQGETFGYPLVSTVGSSLARFTGGGLPNSESSIDLVKVHIDSLTVILRNDIAGDGGDTGRELVSQLQAAIKKITATAATG